VYSKPFDLKFGSYVVSGSPVVAEGVAAGLSDAAPALAAAAAILVALALVLTYRRRRVLLPLALGAGATAITLGGVALAGGSFDSGVAAALPLAGAFGAAWALQLLAGFDVGPPAAAARRVQGAARFAGPAIAVAALASAVAFATLLVSPVPAARMLGGLVAIALLVSFVLALTAGAAVVGGPIRPGGGFASVANRAARRGARVTAAVRPRVKRAGGAARRMRARVRGRVPRPRATRRPGRLLAALGARVAGVARAVAATVASIPAVAARAGGTAWRGARLRPGRVLRLGLALALLGFVAATQIDLTSDQRRLLPTDSLAARDLASIERETGTSGDVNVSVRSNRLLDPAVVRWMSSYQRKVLRAHGFREGRPCGEADLCPALSLTSLFGAGRQSASQIREAVEALPPYFSQNVITRDRRTANIAFRIGAMSPQERQDLVESLRAALDPPRGVDARLAGPVVVAAAGEDDLARSMWLVTLAALLAVAALVGLVRRSLEAVLVVAIPLSLAIGWAFLILFALPIDVDLLSSTMGALVVGACAGPVMLAARDHRAARAADPPPQEETISTQDRAAGQAVAFGAVAGAGFLALTVCDIPALRDLGVAGAVTLPLIGLGLALALPATLTWADRRGGLRVPRTRGELAAAGRALGGSVVGATRAVAGGTRRGARAVRRGVPRAGRKMRAAVTSRR
jgi:predicted RND superfamily exporter protein